jgi:tetratricopeptide (TPR) repeat protein
MRQPDEAPAREPETIGERIRRLRKEKGLKQTALTGPGLTAAQICRIESGKRQASLKAIRRLAAKLEVSPEYLETGIDMTRREELELRLSDLELRMRLDPSDETIIGDLGKLIEAARREGMGDITARAQAALGMTLADRGRLSEALGHLTTAIEHQLLEPGTRPDVYTALANVYCELGRPRDAIALCTEALERIPMEATTSRALVVTYLSYGLSEVGEFEQAESVLLDSVKEDEDSDRNSRARLHWLLARLAAMRGDGRLALSHTREAIALLRETEDTVRLARAHLLASSVLLWSGKTAGVSRYLRLARELFPSGIEAVDQGMLLGYEALFSARQHRFGDALSRAEQALELLPEHELEQDAAIYAKALVLSAKAEYAAAEELFRRVMGSCEKAKFWHEAALVSRDLAEMLDRAGKRYESKNALKRARDFESRLVNSLEERSADRESALGD